MRTVDPRKGGVAGSSGSRYMVIDYSMEYNFDQQKHSNYQKDADMMSTRPRFGYFSILPSHTAAKTDTGPQPPKKDGDGKVITQNRNIYSGSTSTGVLNKSYFSVPKSIYQGDPFDKPPKVKSPVNEKKQPQKEVYRPAMLNKTLSTPAYQYMCENPRAKDPKHYRNEDGSVKVQPRNICGNSLSTIERQKLKDFKYVESDYDNFKKQNHKQLIKSIGLRKGEGPFRAGSPVKDFFNNNVALFDDHEISKKVRTQKSEAEAKVHEANFRPSCRSRDKDFSYPAHMSDFNLDLPKKSTAKIEPFRVISRAQTAKPCPSVAYSRMNLISRIR